MSGDCGHGWGYHSKGPSGPCDLCTQHEEKEEARIAAFINDLADHEGYLLTPPPKNPEGLARAERHAMREFRTTVRALLVKHGLVFS